MRARMLVRTALGVVAFPFLASGAIATPVSLLLFWIIVGIGIGSAARKGAIDLPLGKRLSTAGEPTIWTGVIVAAGFVGTCLVITGMVTSAGWVTTGCLLGLCAAAAMWASRRSWRATDSPPGRATDVQGIPVATVVPEPSTPAQALPTDELCLAWRRSYLQLQRATDEHTRQQVIRARQAYLDELERRDRTGFARWLHDGARAGSDPRRYLNAD
jgi:hypothetical protein